MSKPLRPRIDAVGGSLHEEGEERGSTFDLPSANDLYQIKDWFTNKDWVPSVIVDIKPHASVSDALPTGRTVRL